MTFETSVTLVPHIKSGKLRALGVASANRIALLPEVPTLAESGYPSILAENWYGMYAPAGTPKEVIARLYAELDKSIRSPDVREKLEALTEPEVVTGSGTWHAGRGCAYLERAPRCRSAYRALQTGSRAR